VQRLQEGTRLEVEAVSMGFLSIVLPQSLFPDDTLAHQYVFPWLRSWIFFEDPVALIPADGLWAFLDIRSKEAHCPSEKGWERKGWSQMVLLLIQNNCCEFRHKPENVRKRRVCLMDRPTFRLRA